MLVLIATSPFALSQSLSVSLVDSESNPIADAVIEILIPQELKSQYQDAINSRVDQIDKEFVPHVSTVVAGNYVSFPNSDDILHHVYSFSPINTFNIPLFGKEDSDRFQQSFESTGVIEIGCNIHDWMLAYIYVAESTLTAVSDESGQAIISEVPVGQFEVRVWHSRLAGDDVGMMRQMVFVDGQDTVEEVVLELKRDRRVRRAPSANRNRYR